VAFTPEGADIITGIISGETITDRIGDDVDNVLH
jgi:hypothetical protein